MVRPENYTRQREISPADKAKRVWDERDGALIVRMHNLRKLVLFLGGLLIVAIGSCTYLATKSSVVPFVVMANPETGEIWHVGTVDAASNFEPTEQMKEYFIRNFVTKSRTVPLDPVAYSMNIKEAMNFLTQSTATKLTAQLENDKVADKIAKGTTVTVHIVSVLPMEGSNSYQVRWTEDEYSFGSGTKQTIPYSGLFTADIIKQKDEKILAANPIGFYLTEFSFSKDNTGNQPQNNQNRTTQAQQVVPTR